MQSFWGFIERGRERGVRKDKSLEHILKGGAGGKTEEDIIVTPIPIISGWG
jgi:hypothetical protein